MKKIVIVNNRFFPNSGPERCMFNTIKMFEKDGVTVIPFSVKRSRNVKTPYEKYFVTPLYGDDIVYFNDANNMGMLKKLKILGTCVYSFEAKSKMSALIRDESPDLVYMQGIVNDISPSIIDSCKKYNIPVVMRLSDYNIICGNYYFLRDNNICKDCITKNVFECAKNKCVKNSFMPSFARSLAMFVHNILHVYDYVNAFVCPSSFMRDSMIEAGFPAEKLYHINSFVIKDDYEPCYKNKGYMLYFGRVSPEKGIEYLLEAKVSMSSDVPLIIAGKTNDESYLDSLKQYIADNSVKGVTFAGFKVGDELVDLIKNARFILSPSICPDNSPMSGIESMAFGKPMIGTDIGGITDQIVEGKTGFLVPPKDSDILAEKIDILAKDDKLIETMGKNARVNFEDNFSFRQHYDSLRKLFYKSLKK